MAEDVVALRVAVQCNCAIYLEISANLIAIMDGVPDSNLIGEYEGQLNDNWRCKGYVVSKRQRLDDQIFSLGSQTTEFHGCSIIA